MGTGADNPATADTDPQMPRARGPSRASDADPIAELRRQVEACRTTLNGADDDPKDTGLKGEVQHLREEVRATRSIQVATLVLVVLVFLPIAIRAADSTGRDWGWWSPPARAIAQAKP